jgi:hypothetical protein
VVYRVEQEPGFLRVLHFRLPVTIHRFFVSASLQDLKNHKFYQDERHSG